MSLYGKKIDWKKYYLNNNTKIINNNNDVAYNRYHGGFIRPAPHVRILRNSPRKMFVNRKTAVRENGRRNDGKIAIERREICRYFYFALHDKWFPQRTTPRTVAPPAKRFCFFFQGARRRRRTVRSRCYSTDRYFNVGRLTVGALLPVRGFFFASTARHKRVVGSISTLYALFSLSAYDDDTHRFRP